MEERGTIRAEAQRLQRVFLEAGAVPVETGILQPAGTLLELYGEDIRARAYVTSDPLTGEQMLRPDFTVPVVQMHMAGGAEPARYTYAGEVFRKQEQEAAGRAAEYLQVGFELFDRADPAGADAEVFALMTRALAGLDLDPVTGDIGILRAAVAGLRTTERRKAALMRHIWRPARFRSLLERYGGLRPVPPARARLLSGDLDTLFAGAGPEIGLRGVDEVRARVDALRADAAAPPLAGEEVERLDAILDLEDRAPAALTRLRDLAGDEPRIAAALDRMARRLDALAGLGVAVDDLWFEASHGRSTMEYYDGFVFGFVARQHPEWPPVASGGRYDALTGVLGRSAGGEPPIAAVGGVIRPGLTRRLRAEAGTGL